MKGEGYTERKKEEQEKAWGGRKEVICRIGKDKEITSHKSLSTSTPTKLSFSI